MSTRSETPPNHKPIPKLFHDDLTGAPMRLCISCECDLLIGDVPYMIEKAIKPYNGLKSYATIFEYAMCMKCMDGLKDKISKSSMQNINAYFTSNIDLKQRRDLIVNQYFDEYELWVSNCMVRWRL